MSKDQQNAPESTPNVETNVETPESTNAPESTPQAVETERYSLDRIVAFVASKKGISEDRAAKHVRGRIRAYKFELSKLDEAIARHTKGDRYQPFNAQSAQTIIRLSLRANVANVAQQSGDVEALMTPPSE